MGGFGGGGTAPPAHDCMSVCFVTTLEPVSEAETHEPPARLYVLRVTENGYTAFVVADEDGQPVGTIIDRIDELLRCTEEGFSFVADVTKVAHGIHTVRVQPDPNAHP